MATLLPNTYKVHSLERAARRLQWRSIESQDNLMLKWLIADCNKNEYEITFHKLSGKVYVESLKTVTPKQLDITQQQVQSILNFEEQYVNQTNRIC